MKNRVDALGLHDRAADIWKPLFAVADVFGPQDLSNQLTALAQEMSPDPDRQEEHRQLLIVRGLRTVAGDGGIVAGTTQQIAQMLTRVTELKCQDLHCLLTSWEFVERSMRLPGFETPRRAWELSDAMLTRVEERLA